MFQINSDNNLSTINQYGNNLRSEPNFIIIRAVILTKSGKNRGACVAGYNLDNHQFVRFVRDATSAAEVPFNEIWNISTMDIVEAKVVQSCPIAPQTENVLVPQFGIKRIIKFPGTIEEIRKNIHYNEKKSFMDFTENRFWNVSGFHHSLELISVTDLELRKYTKYDGKITTRASFKYKSKIFNNYRVTDYSFDMRNYHEDTLTISNADIVISIPKEDFIINGVSHGYYKFVAAIYPIDKEISDIFPTSNTETNNNIIVRKQNLQNSVYDRQHYSYKSWTKLEDTLLTEEYVYGFTVQELAKRHKRSNDDIRFRLKKLGLIK